MWQFRDGKQFTLNPGGSTTSDWHNRKGSWRIVGPNQVALSVMWRDKTAPTVSVESKASVLRWSDDYWGQIAKRIVPDIE